jgi:gas vesicle protein
MKMDPAELELDRRTDEATRGEGGFVALAVLAAAAGAGAALLLAPESGSRTRERVGRGLRELGGEAAGTIAQLQREIRNRKSHSRREKRIFALAGVLVGAGLAALLTPESGPNTRKRLGGKLSRIKTGAVDRIERLRRPDNAPEATEAPVRSVQELGRDASDVF